MTQGYLASRDGIRGQHAAAIDGLFAAWDRAGSPGAIVAVSLAGEIIHQSGYGVANIEDDVPFTPDTVLRLGSTSKHLGATCILLLENRGLLSLADDVRQYVPELPDYGVSITLKHLLGMTSGLWDGLNIMLLAGLDPSQPVSREHMLQAYCAQPSLMFAPGDDNTYSNTNYSLITLVIERVSGLSIADFMRVELFAPLGMTNSQLSPAMAQTVPHKARGYQPAAEGGFEAGYMRVELDCNGGVDSTINDMLKWFGNYRDDRLFGPDYRARLEAENRLNDGTLLDYRLGIEVKQYRGREVVRHAGGMPGYLCDFVYLPKADFAVLMFTNLLDPQMLRIPDKIADIVLERSFTKPQTDMFIDSRRAEMAALIGVFIDPTSATVIELSALDDRLGCYLLGEFNELVERHGWLRSNKNQLQLRPVAGTAIPTVELRLGCQPLIRCERIPNPRLPLEGEREVDHALVGNYCNVGLGETHLISVRDGALCIEIPSPYRTLVWRELTRVAKDLYVAIIASEPSCTNVVIQCLRDVEGAITGIEYSLQRCRQVFFARVSDTL